MSLVEPFPTPPFQLLPADADTVSGADDLALSGFVPQDVTVPGATEEPPRPFGKSWLWDDDRGRFKRYGAAPAATHGYDTLIGWIRNAVRIARLTYPIFDDEFGMDDPYALVGEVPTTTLKAQWSRMITDALSIEPRITEVRDFKYGQAPAGSPDDTVLYVDFTVVTDDQAELTIEGVALGGTD